MASKSTKTSTNDGKTATATSKRKPSKKRATTEPTTEIEATVEDTPSEPEAELSTETESAGIVIRDRIKELRRVKASTLLANPKNYRLHPSEQRSGLAGILRDVGIADALIARELDDGRLELIDGHLRMDEAPDTVWPVLVLDVTEQEADKLLAVLDPLAAMAETEVEKLDELLRSLQTDDKGMQRLLDDLAKQHSYKPDTIPTEFGTVDETIETEYSCPRCGYAWSGSTRGGADDETIASESDE